MGFNFGLGLGLDYGFRSHGFKGDESIDIIDPGAGRAQRQQRHPAAGDRVGGQELVLEGEEIAGDGDDRQLLGDAGQDRGAGGVDDPLDCDVRLERLAKVTDFGVFAAADQLEEGAAGAGIGKLQGVEVVKGREFAVAADRQPVIEHGRVPGSGRRIDGLQCIQQTVRRRLIGCVHV